MTLRWTKNGEVSFVNNESTLYFDTVLANVAELRYVCYGCHLDGLVKMLPKTTAS